MCGIYCWDIKAKTQEDLLEYVIGHQIVFLGYTITMIYFTTMWGEYFVYWISIIFSVIKVNTQHSFANMLLIIMNLNWCDCMNICLSPF